MKQSESPMVPGAGIEPARLAATVFESGPLRYSKTIRNTRKQSQRGFASAALYRVVLDNCRYCRASAPRVSHGLAFQGAPAGADGRQAGEPGTSSAARAGAARQPGRAGALPPMDGISHNVDYAGASRTADRLRIIPRYVTWRPLTGFSSAMAGVRRGQDRTTAATSKPQALDGGVCHEGRSGAAVAVREGTAAAREGEPGAQPPAAVARARRSPARPLQALTQGA